MTAPRSILIPFLLAPLIATGAEISPADLEFFEARIRPVLADHCYECHGPEKQKGGLRLDTREATLKGGDSGPAIAAGDPAKSLIIQAVRYTDKELAMPPSKDGSKKLSANVVADLETWVKRGAPDPRSGDAGPIAKAAFDFETERKKWAYRKPERPEVPKVSDPDWVKTPVDAFILAKLDAAQLSPAPPASPRVLIRRMTFDLTGLPPTPDEITAFEKAATMDRDTAVAALTDRLLASPAYGEHWGRHWLDVARYADSLDSRGSGKEGDILDAWRYRDWVVSAFNRDLPYKDFITHQIAGDILATREWDPAKVIATGLFAIGNWGNGDSDKRKVYTDIVDDQVDVVGRAFLGLTVACARCHDHKFDPISTGDYYSLAGFFFSSHILDKFAAPTNGEALMRIPLESPAERAQREALKQRLATVEGQLKGGLRPLTEYVHNIAGKPGLDGMRPKGTDNPSLVVNRTDAEIAFITIKLPARAMALHPGPKSAATLAWRAPSAGKVSIAGRLQDVDPNCGDGIEWSMQAGGTILSSGKVENGRGVQIASAETNVAAGDLVQLVIKRRGEYTCDSTQVEFTIRAADGKTWDARDILAGGEGTIAQPVDGVWWFCEGEGTRLATDTTQPPELLAERDALKAKLAPPSMAQGLQEGGIPGSEYAGFHNARIHARGRYDRLGAERPRSFPELFAAAPPAFEGSGRLALAEWVASPNHPLTARVMANRIWQHHFGEGIVRTTNNFGKLGEPPTHPELLDWLATEFITHHWSIKALHRQIVLSSTYQQSSQSTQSFSKDPENRLLGRQHRKRLSAEELRDAMLAVSGKLDSTVGGPSIRDLLSSRRTLYVTTIRSERATYQMLFDGPDPNGIVEKRTDSVVAPQALWLLNHPFVHEQAKSLAARAERVQQDTKPRLRWIVETLLGRTPTAEEVQLLQGAVPQGTRVEWEKLCQVLLCANEFAYVD